jgi:hypothetical protein
MVDHSGLLAWVRERWAIKLKRDRGEPPPWSNDPIFQANHFCNVRREDDAGTRWLLKNWILPNADDPDLWFAIALYRRCSNEPLAMAKLGNPIPFDATRFVTICESMKGCFRQKAYRLLMHKRETGRLYDLLVKYVLNPAWAQRESFRPRATDSLWDYHRRLCELPEMSNFYVGQVINDLKFAQQKDAPDWWTYAPSGPGSRRGIWRLFDREMKNKPDWSPKIDQETFDRELGKLREALDPILLAEGIPRISASNWQNILCEWDKYKRIETYGNAKGRRYRPRHQIPTT